jgi:hypothetical protein
VAVERERARPVREVDCSPSDRYLIFLRRWILAGAWTGVMKGHGVGGRRVVYAVYRWYGCA